MHPSLRVFHHEPITSVFNSLIRELGLAQNLDESCDKLAVHMTDEAKYQWRRNKILPETGIIITFISCG